MIVDSHAHLYLEHFNEDIEDVMQRSIDQGVDKIFLPNIDHSTVNDLAKLCQAFPNNCFPMIGLHPCSVKEDWREELKQLKAYFVEKSVIFPNNKIWAVGEIGLDYYWDKTYAEEQKSALRQQIEWSIEFKLPIILHTRDSLSDTVAIIKEYEGESIKGIFHCFGGSLEEAQNILSIPDFYLGIGGVLTFKKSGLDHVARDLPLDRLVLETDAPYLTPTPYRGKRNESAYTAIVAQKLADVKNLSLEEISKATSENAANLFGY